MRPRINTKLDELDEEIRPIVEDQYLANRSAAAYFQERANDIERLRDEVVHSADQERANMDLFPKRGEYVLVENGNLWADVDRVDKKMPIISLRQEVRQNRRTMEVTIARFRYSPTSDKLARIG